MKIYWLTALLFLFSSETFAACTSYSGSAIKKVINIGAITVQRDLPVGGTIYSFTAPVSGLQMFDCNVGGLSNGGYYYEMTLFTTPSGIPHVYNTNIEGVGIQMSNTAETDGFYDSPASFYPVYGPVGIYDTVPRLIKLIKTGPVTNGQLSSGLLGRAYGDGDNVNVITYTLSPSSVTSLACSVTTPSLPFPIGDIKADTFGDSVGTIPPDAQASENLGLDCDPGANINVTLGGTQHPDVNDASVLALTGQGNEGVAKGVGIQLLYNGTPLQLNTRLVLKKSPGGQETFPLVARYYQTKTKVAAGSANTSATLNITYQ